MIKEQYVLNEVKTDDNGVNKAVFVEDKKKDIKRPVRPFSHSCMEVGND